LEAFVTRAFWAPGRVNLIGEYTDVSGGLVLPAALDLGIVVEGVADDRIRLGSDAFEGSVDLAPNGEVAADPSGWGRYVAAVARELDALGRPPVGIAGAVRSTLPAGAGLSSSAALEVAVGIALCAVAQFPLEPLELALAAQRAEHLAVGVPCGIMDQATAVLGVAGHAILLDTSSLEHRAIELPPELAIVVVDSGVSRSLEESGYATRRRELERALAALDGRKPSELTTAEAETVATRLDPVAARRLRHVVSENRRVREVVDVLATPGHPSLRRLGELFRAGHDSLRDDFEVSTPELDLLVDLAYEAGAVAARMTGGGFGGSIVALADQDRAPALADEIVAAYGTSSPRQATARICHAADGARELT
jgi:galactokinase